MTMDLIPMASTILLLPKCTSYGVIILYVLNVVLCEVIYLDAPKSIIHLHMLLNCASLRHKYP
jgi:hypothetical protein